jgi:NAD(P)-dependent dehydrogenase (short-subunit alcohol dehydrogenase family)
MKSFDRPIALLSINEPIGAKYFLTHLLNPSLDAQVTNKRIGTPEEIANAIVFIGSDKASYIIGASLAVDGGMIAD